MGFAAILLMALGLAMDAFAVCIAAGASGMARGARATFRLAFHFGLFQFLMPVLGWTAGARVARWIEALDHWVAFALLAVVGVRMIRSGLGAAERLARDPSKGMTLLTLSVATSIDALAVGISLAMIDVPIWLPSAVIGMVAAILSGAGVLLGRRLGVAFGRRMELAGGLLLILIGAKILFDHISV